MIKWVLAVVLLILIGFAAYLGYFVLINFYSAPTDFNVKYSENISDAGNALVYSSIKQSYDNMRFRTSRITYYFANECARDKMERMAKAFEYIQNRTGIEFYESSLGDIEITCGEEYKKEELFVAGEGGPSSVINTSLFKVISGGQIMLLYFEPPCEDKYNVELHELLHVFGFGHSDNPKSIMYNLTSCDQKVDEDVIDRLISIYRIPSLPDLYFKDVYASKRGNYLNINFTMINQGLGDAQNVVVNLTVDSNGIDKFDFDEIKIGEGRIYYAGNIKVPMNTKSIKLTIINAGEISDSNNEVVLTLD